MTMIISAHLGDCILIASDKRSMHCDLETGNMRLATNDEWTVSMDDDSADDDFEYNCSCGSDEDHEDEI